MKDEGASAAAVSRGSRRRGDRKKSRASVGKAITKAGSSKPKPTPKPEPGSRSTGKTIQRTGAPLKPAPKRKPPVSSAFGDKPLAKADFREQRREQRDKVRGAADRMPQRVRLPRLPLLRDGYTDRQRDEIIDATTSAVQQGIRDRRDAGGSAQSALARAFELDSDEGLRRLGDRETRRALNKLSGAVETRKTQLVDEHAPKQARGLSRAEKVRVYDDAERAVVRDASEARPAQPKTEVQVAGVNVPVEDLVDDAIDRVSRGAPKSVRGALNIMKVVPLQTGRATVEHPGEAAGTNARFIRDSALGAVAGAADTVKQVAQGESVPGTLKKLGIATLDDYKRFYGPAAAGDATGFRENVRHEGGIVRVGLDAAAAAGVTSKAAGSLAKTGSVGRRARGLVSDDRPALRYSPGEDAVRRQRSEADKAFPSLLRAGIQRGTDEARSRVQERRIRATRRIARGEDGRVDRLVSDGSMPALRPTGGTQRPGPDREVVPVFKRTTNRLQRRDVAKRKGQAVDEIRRAQAEVETRARDAVKGLSERETAAWVFAHRGLASPDDPAAAREQLQTLRDLITSERERRGVQPKRLSRRGDTVRVIDDLIAHADEAFTPRVRAAADQTRRIEAEVADANPALPPQRALLRRVAQQADVLGIVRGAVDERELRSARQAALREAQKNRRAAERAVTSAKVREAAARALASRDVARSDREILRGFDTYREAEARVRAAEKELARARKGFGNEARYGSLNDDERLSASVSRRAEAEAEVASARDQLRSVIADIEKLADAEMRKGNRDGAARLGRGPVGGLARLESRRGDLQAAEAALRTAIDEERAARSGASPAEISRAVQDGLEPVDQYIARVQAAARDAGLPEAAYFPSEDLWQSVFSDSAAGGPRAAADYRRYTGDTFRLGRETLDPEVFFSGLRRGVKMNVNWRLVADTIERHAHPELRDMPARELLRRADDLGLDGSEWAVWRPGRYRQAAAKLDDDAHDWRGDDIDTPEQVAEALERATIPSLDELRALAAGDGFPRGHATLIPRAAFDEVMSATRPQGGAMRALNIARAKTSRALFAFNVPWVMANFVGAALPSALRGMTPLALVRSQLAWKTLEKETPDGFRALRRELGIDHQRLQDVQQPKLGATAARSRIPGVAQTVGAWHAFRRTPLGRRARPLSASVDAWLRVEQHVNSDQFRKALLTTEARREAYRRIDENAGLINGAIARLSALADPRGLGTKRLQRELQDVLADPRDVEFLGERVSDVLGDWQTFTRAERNAMGVVFLYPYLRYSLRWLFATMPLQHPIMTTVLAQLGQLHADEVRQVLGGDALPYQLGKVYFTDDGKLREIDLSKVNPSGNAITEAKGWQAGLGLVAPYWSWLISQVTETDPFYGRPWQVEGRTQYERESPESVGTHARVLLNDIVSLSPVGRELLKQTAPGKQGDDALPFSPRPVEYKPGGEADRAAKRHEHDDLAGGPAASALRRNLLLVPEASRDRENTQARLEREGKTRKRRQRRGIFGGLGTGPGSFGGLSGGGDFGGTDGFGGL